MNKKMIWVALFAALLGKEYTQCAQQVSSRQEQLKARLIDMVRNDDPTQKARAINLLARIGAVGYYTSRGQKINNI